MSLFQRRILFAVFIIIFLILTPVVSFYAAGYDFNFQSGRVSATGILIIETEPKEATINLGDKKKYNWLYNLFYSDNTLATPQKIRNLLPDEYEVVLTKDGYFNYEKKIELKPRQTLVLDNIILFKKSLPSLEVEGNILAKKLSNDKTKIASIVDENLIILNLQNNQKTIIPLNTQSSVINREILWAPSDNKILITGGDYPVINIAREELEASLKNLSGASIQNVSWDAFSDNTIYVNTGKTIKRVDLSQKNASNIFQKEVRSDFLVKGNNLYVIEKDENSDLLNIYSTDGQELMKSIPIPDSKNYKFVNKNHQLINLINSKNDILYLIDTWSLLPIQDSINNFKEGQWINNDKILYWNYYEIWLYDINSKNPSHQGGASKKLLTRISNKINSALKHPGSDYIIYSTDNAINVIEYNDENYNKTFKILDFANISSSYFAPSGSAIYFQGKINEQEGLYKLEIR